MVARDPPARLRGSLPGVTGFEDPLARRALQEVVDLHAFFETWLGGSCPETEAAFARVESALADSFSMVSPDGRRLSRGDVAGWLRQAYGSRAAHGAFRIAIREPDLLLLHPPLVVLGYVEEQELEGALIRRRSTAVLAAPANPGRPQWLALHETWIDPDS